MKIVTCYTPEFADDVADFLIARGFKEYAISDLANPHRFMQRRISDPLNEYGFVGCAHNDLKLHINVEIHEFKIVDGSVNPHAHRSVTMSMQAFDGTRNLRFSSSWCDAVLFKSDYKRTEQQLIYSWGLTQNVTVTILTGLLLKTGEK